MVQQFVYGAKGNVPDYMVDICGDEYKIISDERGSVRLVVKSAMVRSPSKLITTTWVT